MFRSSAAALLLSERLRPDLSTRNMPNSFRVRPGHADQVVPAVVGRSQDEIMPGQCGKGIAIVRQSAARGHQFPPGRCRYPRANS